MAGSEIVGRIDHQIRRRNCLEQGASSQRFTDGPHFNFGVDGQYAACKRIGLVLADCRSDMTDLALQIGEIDRIAIRQQYASDTSRPQIQRHRTPQPPCTDYQYRGIRNALLTCHPDVRQ